MLSASTAIAPTTKNPLVTTRIISSPENNSPVELLRHDISKDNKFVILIGVAVCVVLMLMIVNIGVIVWIKRRR